MVWRGVFNYVLDKVWLERNQNPALKPFTKRAKPAVTPHATLPWEVLPDFFHQLEPNITKGSPVILAAA